MEQGQSGEGQGVLKNACSKTSIFVNVSLGPLQTVINITMGKILLKHRFYDVTFLPKNSSCFPFHFGSTPISLTW